MTKDVLPEVLNHDSDPQIKSNTLDRDPRELFDMVRTISEIPGSTDLMCLCYIATILGYPLLRSLSLCSFIRYGSHVRVSYQRTPK